MALIDGKRRIYEETLLQKIEVCLLRHILRCILDQTEYQFLDCPDEWDQKQDCRHTEYRVHQCDSHRTHDVIQKFKMNKCIDCVKCDGPEQHTEQVVDQVDKSRTLSVLVSPDRRKKHRTCRADTDTHGDWKRCGKRDTAGHRQCL